MKAWDSWQHACDDVPVTGVHVSTGWDDIAICEVEFDPIEVDDLRRRLRNTRWAERETVDDCSQGVPLEFVQDLAAYWIDGYDFVAAAGRMNAWPQFTPH
jgi:hypothetical protein